MERRIHPRVKVDCPVDIVINPKNHSPLVISGKATDISEGGLCFELDEPLPLKDSSPVFSKIDIYPCQIEAFVELIWNQPVHEQQKFRYGGRFLNIEEEQKLNLKKTIWLNEQFIDENLEPIMHLIDEHTKSIKQRVEDFFKKDGVSCLQEFISLKPGDTDQFRINNKLDSLVQKGDELENIIHHKVISNEIKKNFRSMLESWIYQSPIMKHALKKPYGYPGDYELLEMIYNNQEISNGNAQYFDRYFLNNPYAVAVRNRKDLMREILRDFILSRKDALKIEMFNLACGSCREIRELLENPIDYNGKAIFTCVDFDDKALAFSKQEMQKLPRNIEFQLVKENILNLASKPDNYMSLFKGKDLVYSIGLADYMPDRILKKLIQFCYSILNPKGQLIIAFKDRDKNTHAPLPPGWYCDWTFVPRNKDKVINLINECELKAHPEKILWEKSGVIFFTIISKPHT